MSKRIILGESGGPTPVIDWELAGALAAAQRHGWTVYGMRNGLEGLLSADVPGNIVDLTNMDPMSFCFNGPGAGLGTTRLLPEDAELRAIAGQLKRLEIDGVIYIGGNDSAAMLQRLSQCSDAQCVHGIKTIDNDLPGTHHCPGFGSAALFNATALKNLFSDVGSFRARHTTETDGKTTHGWKTVPVMVYQAMGRNTGWLTQAMSFAKVDPKGEIDPARPPHVFVSWERPFEETPFLDRVQAAIDEHGTATVVVGEDVSLPGEGKPSLAKREKAKAKEELKVDKSGNPIFGGATSFSSAVYMATLIAEKLKVRTAPATIKEMAFLPQHIQRSHSMSPVDASDAYRVGWGAVEAIAAGENKRSVVLRRESSRTTTGLVDLSTIAHKVREVEPEYIQGLEGPTQAFVDEFIDLIGGPAAIPHYSDMRMPPVE